jgi:hypothetical protein
MSSFPWQSPYVFAGNDPVRFIDFMGMSQDDPNDFVGPLPATNNDGSLDFQGSHFIKNNSGKWEYGTSELKKVWTLDDESAYQARKQKYKDDMSKYTFNNAFDGVMKGVINSLSFDFFNEEDMAVAPWERDFYRYGQGLGNGINAIRPNPVMPIIKMGKDIVEELIQEVTKTEKHHLLPREYKDFFERAGLDIEDFKIPLAKAKHRLKPNGVHTKQGGNWNERWREFKNNYPDANDKQILKHLDELRKEFGI